MSLKICQLQHKTDSLLQNNIIYKRFYEMLRQREIISYYFSVELDLVI